MMMVATERSAMAALLGAAEQSFSLLLIDTVGLPLGLGRVVAAVAPDFSTEKVRVFPESSVGKAFGCGRGR